MFSANADGDTDPDYVYYNATIINNRTNTPFDRSADPAVRFQETRDSPIVGDASKYNFSIIRFTMNGPNKDLPLFIPVIRTGADNPGGFPLPPGQSYVNLTIYSITVKMVITTTSPTTTTTYYSTQPIWYVPETLDTSVAPVPDISTTQTGQDLTSRYYWVYTYSHLLDNCVRPAFQRAMDDIATQASLTLKTSAPYITYNPTSNLFTLYTDAAGFGGALRTSAGSSQDENATLYFNSNMYGLFTNFKNQYVNETGPGGSATERTNLIYTGAEGYGVTTAGVPYAQNVVSIGSGVSLKYFWNQVQDYESTSTLWSPIESIVFNSTLLPLIFEQTGDPVRFGQSNSDTALTGSQSAFQPIITDIALPVENAQAYRELIYYAPQAEYRLASFARSKQPINLIDIQVYWKNRLDGQLYPVYMFNCSSVSVKIMFRRRGVFDYPHPAKAQQIDV
jgi:hypothetical protein